MTAKPGSAEPYLPDSQVEELANVLRKKVPGLPQDTMVVTYLVPEKNGAGPWVVFGVISKAPEVGQNPFMTQGAVFQETFEERLREAKHLVGVPDPALSILIIAAKKHVETYQAMIGMSN